MKIDNQLSDDERPMSRTAKKYRRERETSYDEDNIPLMELAKRMREQEFAEAYSPSDDQNPINEIYVQSKPMIPMLKFYCKLL